MSQFLESLSTWVAAGGLLTLFAAFSRLWPYAQRILWDRIAPPYRVWLTTVPAVLGCIAGVLANPADWLTQVEALLIVLMPLLAPGTLPAGAKHAVLLLVFCGIALGQTGCSLFNPHVESPCAGMVCVSVITVPAGELLVCAKSQLELDNKVATLRARGIVK